MMRKYLLIVAVMLTSAWALAAEQPSGYYSAAEGKKQQALLKSLCGIISSGVHGVSYDGLWDAYPTTDAENGYYLDMYSNVQYKVNGGKENKSYSKIGDCVNREHSFPQSWFKEGSPMKSDLFHVYPTDGYVNNQRSSYPFGECAGGTRLSNGSYVARGRLGTSTTPGYTGKVWEPDDEYKGDFARTYFYMATRYNSQIANWSGNGTAGNVLAGNSYPVYKDWYITMLLRWNELDPVSEKEIKRNNAVYDIQGNRNPYIDHPELAEYIWGDKQDLAWSEGATSTDPVVTLPANKSTIDLGAGYVGSTLTEVVKVKARNITQPLTVTIAGEGFTASATTISASAATAGTEVTVTYRSDVHATATGTLTIGNSEASSTVTLKAEAKDMIEADDATNVTATSFQANWVGGTNVESYTLYVAGKGYVVPGTVTLLLDEDFNNMTWASAGNTYADNGYFRLGTGSGSGSTTSPAIDLTGSNGVVTAIIDARAYSGDSDVEMKVSVLGKNGNVADSKTVTLTSTVATYAILLNGDNSEGCKIKIENLAAKKRVQLKRAKIYSGNATDMASMAPRRAATEQGDTLTRTITGITDQHYVVTGLARLGTFKYQVKAVYADGTESALSNEVEVTLEDNGGLLGDVNGDGVVNAADVSELVALILENKMNALGDMNHDGALTAADVSVLVNLIIE